MWSQPCNVFLDCSNVDIRGFFPLPVYALKNLIVSLQENHFDFRDKELLKIIIDNTIDYEELKQLETAVKMEFKETLLEIIVTRKLSINIKALPSGGKYGN